MYTGTVTVCAYIYILMNWNKENPGYHAFDHLTANISVFYVRTLNLTRVWWSRDGRASAHHRCADAQRLSRSADCDWDAMLTCLWVEKTVIICAMNGKLTLSNWISPRRPNSKAHGRQRWARKCPDEWRRERPRCKTSSFRWCASSAFHRHESGANIRRFWNVRMSPDRSNAKSSRPQSRAVRGCLVERRISV